MENDKSKGNSYAAFPFPREPHETLIFGPYPPVLEVGVEGALSCMEPSPTVSGGEAASKTGCQRAFFFTVLSRLLGGICLRDG